MKKIQSLLILIAVICLTACRSQLHVVTVYVDTTQIDQSSIDQYVTFGQPAGIANKEFITNVRKHDLILWQGMSTSDPSHMVTISSIMHESGDFLIGQKHPKSNKAKQVNFKQLMRKIVAKASKEQPYAEEKYSLKFIISNKPGQGEFEIDPKIRSH